MTTEAIAPERRSFKFTATSVKKTTADFADRKGITLRDTEQRGLVLRKQKRDWMVALERKVRGKVWRVTIGPYDPATFNVAAARAEVQRILGEITGGTFVASKTAGRKSGVLADMSMVEAVDLHARVNPELRPSTIRSYRFAVGYLTDGKPLLVRNLTTDYVRTAYARLLEDLSAATANQMLRSVKALWNTWAAEHPEDTAPTRNPVSPITGKRRGTMRRSNVREGALPSGLRRKWIRTALSEMEGRGPTGTAYAGIVMLALTGLRLVEVMGLTWDEVDAAVLNIPAERMKGGEDLRDRPITAAMRRVLNHQKSYHPKSKFVFPARVGDGHMVDLRKALDPLNVTVLGQGVRIRAHDLRRTFATTCDVIGIPEVAKKLLVAHAIDSVTMDYSRSIRSELPRYADKVEKALLS